MAISIKKTILKMETEEIQEYGIYIIRTLMGKEEKLIDAIVEAISRKEDTQIYSIFKPETVNGYLFTECGDIRTVNDALRKIPNYKGIINKPLSNDEVEKYFKKDGETVVVNEKDIVEMIAGPFKGDKARVLRLTPGKDEIVIEPLNMAVPIPITLNINDIRVIKQKE